MQFSTQTVDGPVFVVPEFDILLRSRYGIIPQGVSRVLPRSSVGTQITGVSLLHFTASHSASLATFRGGSPSTDRSCGDSDLAEDQRGTAGTDSGGSSPHIARSRARGPLLLEGAAYPSMSGLGPGERLRHRWRSVRMIRSTLNPSEKALRLLVPNTRSRSKLGTSTTPESRLGDPDVDQGLHLEAVTPLHGGVLLIGSTPRDRGSKTSRQSRQKAL